MCEVRKGWGVVVGGLGGVWGVLGGCGIGLGGWGGVWEGGEGLFWFFPKTEL